jgi:hypothetical protein
VSDRLQELLAVEDPIAPEKQSLESRQLSILALFAGAIRLASRSSRKGGC